MKRLYSFTGASGTGKSTLLNILKEFGVNTLELSARPYLPKNDKDYVENSNDIVQYRINYGTKMQLCTELVSHNAQLFTSRCAIDNLAYGRVLDVGSEIRDIVEQEIEYLVKPYTKVFYLPIEFDLPNDDKVRGVNEEIKYKTDEEVQNILKEFNIEHHIIHGSVEQRTKQLLEHCKEILL